MSNQREKKVWEGQKIKLFQLLEEKRPIGRFLLAFGLWDKNIFKQGANEAVIVRFYF